MKGRYTKAIERLRRSTVAIIRAAPDGKGSLKSTFSGTGWCVVLDKYFATASHVLDMGGGRDGAEFYIAYFEDNNTDRASDVRPVTIKFEDASHDYAILEAKKAGPRPIPPLPVIYDNLDDGIEVVSLGYPIRSGPTGELSLSTDGKQLTGIEIWWKPTAKLGITAARYPLNGKTAYEFTIPSTNGESGMAIARVEPFAVIATMREVLSIVGADGGIMNGPSRGWSVESMADHLKALGVKPLKP